MSITGRGPVYNERRGSGNISSTPTPGRQGTTGSAVYVDVDFQWYGGQVENAVDSAMINAMDRILDVAVTIAVPVARYRDGFLQASIKKLEIILEGTAIHGEFGSALHYALYQELGTYQFSGTFYLSGAGATVAPMMFQAVEYELKKAGY